MSSTSDLLEREAPLAALNGLLGRLLGAGSHRPGACVLLHGEAGVGKTALLRAWQAGAAGGERVRWLWGGCEPLLSPLPLGPLLECLAALPPGLSQAVQTHASRPQVFGGLLELMRDARRPTVMVVEDAHWADGATLDLLRFVGRRIDSACALLVVTYREEALEPDHPLRGVLGSLPAAHTLRLALAPLSPASVAAWAQRCGRAPGELHRVTGGNPFFVAELLAGAGGPLPPTVRDAVLARAQQLSPAGRELLVAASICPAHLEPQLLQALAPAAAPAVAEVVQSGLLVDTPAGLAFRHELARQALAASVPAGQARRLHAAALAALADEDVPPARRVHHAQHAGLAAEVRRLAPVAAAEATQSGAQRQVALLLGLAIEATPRVDARARAALLEQRAHAWMLGNAFAAAIDDRLAALDLRTGLRDPVGIGRNRLWLARLHWMRDGDLSQAMPWAEQAIDGLEAAGASRELADAYSTRSHLHLVADDMPATLAWGRRALALAETLDDARALSHALNNVGTAQARSGERDAGLALLQRSLQVAKAAGLHADVARATLNLFLVLAAERRLAAGLAWADAGVEHAERHGLDVYTVRLRIRRAYARMMAGDFAGARDDLDTVARLHDPSPMEAATARFVGAQLEVRCGREGARSALQDAAAGLVRHHVELWFTHRGAALAEAAWLEGDLPAARAAALAALPHLQAGADLWRWAEAALWLHRAQGSVPAPPAAFDGRLPAPPAAEMRGELDAARQAWSSLGCHYDAALAGLLAREHGAERPVAALETLQAMGALAAVRAARRLGGRTRLAGARGAYRHARQDPLGLTTRERDVLECLRLGLSNQQIAERWQRSERTVEKHVAALLGKLGARHRHEAVRLAGEA